MKTSAHKFSALNRLRGQRRADHGMSLVELMISMAVGMVVVAICTALFLGAQRTYITQDDRVELEDSGRYALELISRSIRQSAYENWGAQEGAAQILAGRHSPSINGLDATTLGAKSEALSGATALASGSDVLAVRFVGSGGGSGDGSVLNCAGFSVAEPVDLEVDRGWSIFYTAVSNGEPELRCKYRGADANWNSAAIVRGVESFQVLYGIDTDEDGLTNRFVNATAVRAMDDALVFTGATPEERVVERNRRTFWKRVTAVKVSFLIRGSRQATRSDVANQRYDLFGADYAFAFGATDVGTSIDEAKLNATIRNRARKIFSTTVQLRNQAQGSQP